MLFLKLNITDLFGVRDQKFLRMEMLKPQILL